MHLAAVLRLDDHRRTRKGKDPKAANGGPAPKKPQAEKPQPRRGKDKRPGLKLFPGLDPIRLRRPISVLAGCAVLYGLWAFGPLQWVGDWVASGIDGQAQRLGYRVEAVQIAGAEGQARADIERALHIAPGETILRMDLNAALARVESVDWVQSAAVMRFLPNTVFVAVTARTPYALWQYQNVVRVIDVEGRVIRMANVGDYARLPLLVGDGAPVQAKTMIEALAQYPRIAAETDAMVFVGGRRWNLRLKSGADVLLPEFGALEALERLEKIDVEKPLLTLPLDRIDMRLAGQMAVRPKSGPEEVIVHAQGVTPSPAAGAPETAANAPTTSTDQDN